jgi:general secretion pathway protein F
MHSALIYPLLLVGLSLVTLGIVVTVLVPSIASAFAESGRPLPAALRFLVAVQSRWPEVLAGAGTGLAIGVYAFISASRRPGPALLLDRLKLKAPLFGRIAAGRETARLARTLGTLLRAGVPMLRRRVPLARRSPTATLPPACAGLAPGSRGRPPSPCPGA